MDPIRFPPGTDPGIFLREHWQQHPLLIRGALPGWRSPIDPDELAGLACERDVESRLVLESGERPWEVRHGPFGESDFAGLPESHWTLLVQDCDKHIPEIAEILDAFSFIPDWRLDDVMISYAEDQGSVGPHTDEYDVFLIQAIGRRRWRIDPHPAPGASCLPGLDLRILDRFEPREQWLLEPGDMLYLPPGVPHWGIAEGPCMTWSVGLRAPHWREVATAWCDHAIERLLPRERYRDRAPEPPAHRGEIPAQLAREIRGRIETALTGADDPLFAEWLGRYLTEPKENLEPVPADETLDPAELRAALHNGARLVRGPSRLLFSRLGDGTVLLFAGGETFQLPAHCAGLAEHLTSTRVHGAPELAPWLDRPECLSLLATLYNQGHHARED